MSHVLTFYCIFYEQINYIDGNGLVTLHRATATVLRATVNRSDT